jgi:hypothetical protein
MAYPNLIVRDKVEDKSMRKKPRSEDKPKLNEVEVLRRAQATLEEHLPLEADGYCCTSATLYEVLIGVAAQRSTIESVCAELAGAPDGETIRGYLNEQLRVEELAELERRINAALAGGRAPPRGGGAIEAAIDCHDRPYYGKADQAQALWVRGKAKDGTTRFYRVATAYAIVRGQRVTLAPRFVLPEDETVEVVADLWRGLRRRGWRFSCLYLDKGFASVEVFGYLQSRGLWLSAEPRPTGVDRLPDPRQGRRHARLLSGQQKLSHRAYVPKRPGPDVHRGNSGVPRVHHRQAHRSSSATRRVVGVCVDGCGLYLA